MTSTNDEEGMIGILSKQSDAELTRRHLKRFQLSEPSVQLVEEVLPLLPTKRFACLDRLFKLLEDFVGWILQARFEHGDPRLQPLALLSRCFRLTVLLELAQPRSNPIQLLLDVLSDRPKV